MSVTAIRRVPEPRNEPVKTYAPGSPERAELKARIKSMSAERVDIPLVIDGQKVTTGKTSPVVSPHNHRHVIADAHEATTGPCPGRDRCREAGAAQLGLVVVRRPRRRHSSRRRPSHHEVPRGHQRRHHDRPVEDGAPVRDRRRMRTRRLLPLQRRLRPGPDQRAAGVERRHVEPDRLSSARGLRLRDLALQLHRDRRQPCDRARPDGQRHRLEARAHRDAQRLGHRERPRRGGHAPRRRQPRLGRLADDHGRGALLPDLAGVHFTGSTAVFQSIWSRVGNDIAKYRGYPRIVGETGGKDFIIAHPSARPHAQEIAVAIARGRLRVPGPEVLGGLPRAYMPKSIWPRTSSKERSPS
jgi:1-pyrroline-5-carboxylate dehydrogenase